MIVHAKVKKTEVFLPEASGVRIVPTVPGVGSGAGSQKPGQENSGNLLGGRAGFPPSSNDSRSLVPASKRPVDLTETAFHSLDHLQEVYGRCLPFDGDYQVQSLQNRSFVKVPILSSYLIGYARVSRGDDQSNALQTAALSEAGCQRTFEETASGGRWDRPKLHEMLGQLRAGDTVVVWKLDRLTRSLKDLLHIMEKIKAAGAGFRSITESIDTTTPAGLMMMQMVGVFAEFERAMIKERTRAGLDQARAEGRVGGRRPILTPAQMADVIDNVNARRKSAAEMARLYKVSQPTISRIVAKARLASRAGLHL